jgi:hypothetical protein
LENAATTAKPVTCDKVGSTAGWDSMADFVVVAWRSLAMADITFSLAPRTVALVVRGKKSPTDSPGLLEQHADCALSDGSPIGFYGEQNGGSGNASGFGMQGAVWEYSRLCTERPYYVNFDSAVAYGAISTLLTISVTAPQANAFTDAWDDLKKTPGSFNIAGGNCSTHASYAFIKSGILTDGIPGLDTPNNLYEQLASTFGAKTKSMSGYFGFIPFTGGHFTIKFREFKLAPTAAVTADRSRTSFA